MEGPAPGGETARPQACRGGRRTQDGYMSDSSSLRCPLWAVHGDHTLALGPMPEDGDEMEEKASALQKLTWAPDAGRQGQSNPVSWRDLEVSCQQLDAAQIRISSLDLSCMEEDDIPLDLFEDDGNSPGQPPDKGPREPKGPEVAYSFDYPSAGAHRNPTARGEDLAMLRAGMVHLSSAGGGKRAGPLQASANGGTPSACGSGPQSSTGSGVLSCSGGSFSSASSSSGSGPRAATAIAGDMSTSRLPSHQMSSLGVQDGGPESQAAAGAGAGHVQGAGILQGAGRAQGAGISQEAGHAERAGISGGEGGVRRAASLVLQTEDSRGSPLQQQMADVGTAQDPREGRPVSSVRYSSLVLPGAVPREARGGSMRRYVRAMKLKCGELFTTTTRKPKS